MSSFGLWVCEDEIAQKNVFGIRIDDATTKEFQSKQALIDGLKKHFRLQPSPIARFHGTSCKAAQSIILSGLRASFGMLGFGCYLTTFWKAAGRFGRRQNEAFALRPCGGAVVRVYACLAPDQIERRDGTKACY